MEAPPAADDALYESLPESLSLSVARQNAIHDAREMQAAVVRECYDAGTEPPPYHLSELIGKGSFGRVYKACGVSSGHLVAVKIINIENADVVDRGADTFGDIVKEIETLKLLGSSGAKNVNAVTDALLVGHNMWMVTEYCGGGSVSTLMKPTGRLSEQWIVPILREVAEALFWVHKHGIIHRDIKCANVLVMENGSVQLCDFGVAGIVQTKFDKRSTFTGSLHWMAPELFNQSVNYGIEVDIWAFGSMAFEAASGLPPNATFRDIPQFGAHLKHNCPRLEGDHYSAGLKDMIARCMVEEPSNRPSIEELQRHPYIRGTEIDYPTQSLSRLVATYRNWEAQGGSRASLFSPHGAQRVNSFESTSSSHDEWDFNTLQAPHHQSNSEILRPTFDAPSIVVEPGPELPKPQPRRRRAPPPNMRIPIVPLLKVFDPNTISKYEDNARTFYNPLTPPLSSDLPLRAQSDNSNVRESLIDLDAAFDAVSTIRFAERPLSSDPTDNGRRRTMEWQFPSDMPASAGPRLRHGINHGISDDEALTVVPVRESRLAQVVENEPTLNNRMSTLSLIDLDDSLPTPRPSTANSDAPSDISNAPFDLEWHASQQIPYRSTSREPSIYVEDDSFNSSTILNIPIDRSQLKSPVPPLPNLQHLQMDSQEKDRLSNVSFDADDILKTMTAITSPPPRPEFPSIEALQATGTTQDVKGELLRLISSLGDHLSSTNQFLETLPVRKGNAIKKESSQEQS